MTTVAVLAMVLVVIGFGFKHVTLAERVKVLESRVEELEEEKAKPKIRGTKT